jgi:DNA mismatch repair protein MutS
MSFIADKQTLEDMNLLGKYKPHSIYSLFNKVSTTGAERMLEAMFREPLSDPAAINRRSAVFRYFQRMALVLPFSREQLGIVEDYLGGGAGNLLLTGVAVFRKKVAAALMRDGAYAVLEKSLLTVIEVLNALSDLLKELEGAESPYQEPVALLKGILHDRRLAWLPAKRSLKHLSLTEVAAYDHLFRHVLQDQMDAVLQEIYRLDLFIAVSNVAEARGFSYAEALPASAGILRAAAIRHPAIEGAVANPAYLHQESNMLFLTGANMAGKSTFMKAFGTALYLAHMGFPVAAEELVFSVREGIYSSINVPDDLAQGYSHFYAEVLRVKTVAEQVSEGRHLLVIFDELFKGTNVKDAYDATLAVTEAFARYPNCLFIISTHIIEVGETLRGRCRNLQFAYLPTIMEGRIPRYPYTMQQGITSDRHGMMIIGNEGILDILKT